MATSMTREGFAALKEACKQSFAVEEVSRTFCGSGCSFSRAWFALKLNFCRSGASVAGGVHAAAPRSWMKHVLVYLHRQNTHVGTKKL